MKVTPTGYVTTDLGGGLQSYPAAQSQPFLGGDAWDVLKFEHSVANGQMYVGLDSGMAMFGNGVGSPLVTFAEIGPAIPTMLTGSALSYLVQPMTRSSQAPASQLRTPTDRLLLAMMRSLKASSKLTLALATTSSR